MHKIFFYSLVLFISSFLAVPSTLAAVFDPNITSDAACTAAGGVCEAGNNVMYGCSEPKEPIGTCSALDSDCCKMATTTSNTGTQTTSTGKNCSIFDTGFCADSCDSSAAFKYQGTMDDCNAQGRAFCCVPSSTTTTSGNTNNTVSTTGTTTDTGCYDEFGTSIVCKYNPATGQPINTGCYDEFGTSIVCKYNPATGQPLNTVTNNGGGNGGVGGSVAGGSVTCPSGFNLQSGVCIPGSASGIGLSDKSVFDVIATVLNWLLGILGVLGVLAFVISGTQYLLSAGDEDLAKTAKRNMTYAIIGLAIALTGLIVVNAIAGLTGAGGVTNY